MTRDELNNAVCRLIEQSRSGACDQRLFADVFSNVDPALRGTLRQFRFTDDQINDLAAEVWGVAAKKMSSCKSAETFVAWICKIARRMAYRKLSMLRIERSRYTAISDDEQVVDCGTAPICSLEQSMICRRVIEHLPPGAKRDVLLRTYVNHVKNDSDTLIGHDVDVAVSSVKTLRSRATTALRELADAGALDDYR